MNKLISYMIIRCSDNRLYNNIEITNYNDGNVQDGEQGPQHNNSQFALMNATKNLHTSKNVFSGCPQDGIDQQSHLSVHNSSDQVDVVDVDQGSIIIDQGDIDEQTDRDVDIDSSVDNYDNGAVQGVVQQDNRSEIGHIDVDVPGVVELSAIGLNKNFSNGNIRKFTQEFIGITDNKEQINSRGKTSKMQLRKRQKKCKEDHEEHINTVTNKKTEIKETSKQTTPEFKEPKNIDTTKEYEYDLQNIIKNMYINLSTIKSQFDKKIINLDYGNHKLEDVLGENGGILEHILYRINSERKYKKILKFFNKKKLLENMQQLRTRMFSKLYDKIKTATRGNFGNSTKDQQGIERYNKATKKEIIISNHQRHNDIEYKYINKDVVYINEQDVELIKEILECKKTIVDGLMGYINEFIEKRAKSIDRDHMAELFDFITGYCNHDDNEIKKLILNKDHAYTIQKNLSNIYRKVQQIEKFQDDEEKMKAINKLRKKKFLPFIQLIFYYNEYVRKQKENKKKIEKIEQFLSDQDTKLVNELFIQLWLIAEENNTKIVRGEGWLNLNFKEQCGKLKKIMKHLYKVIHGFINKHKENTKAHELIKGISDILEDRKNIDINKNYNYDLQNIIKDMYINIDTIESKFDRGVINLDCGNHKLEDVLGKNKGILDHILYRIQKEKKYQYLLPLFHKQELLKDIDLLKKSISNNLRNNIQNAKNQSFGTKVEDKEGLKRYNEAIEKEIIISEDQRDNDDVAYKYINGQNEIVYINKQDVDLIESILECKKKILDDLMGCINKFINENEETIDEKKENKETIDRDHMIELFDLITGYCNHNDSEIQDSILNQDPKTYTIQKNLSDIYNELQKIKKLEDDEKKKEAINTLKEKKFLPLIAPIFYYKKDMAFIETINNLDEIANLVNNFSDRELVHELFVQLWLPLVDNISQPIRGSGWNVLDFKKQWGKLEKIIEHLHNTIDGFINKHKENINAHELIKGISDILEDKIEDSEISNENKKEFITIGVSKKPTDNRPQKIFRILRKRQREYKPENHDQSEEEIIDTGTKKKREIKEQDKKEDFRNKLKKLEKD